MTPQPRTSRRSRFTKRGPLAAAALTGLGENGLEVLAHHALENDAPGAAAQAGVPAAAGYRAA